MTFHLVDNFLHASALESSSSQVDETVFTRIRAAQRDHVSIDFKEGIVRIILPDVTEDVVEHNRVRDGSRTQWWATLIANHYNLQPFLYKSKAGSYSLVIVSQLGRPIIDVEALARQLSRMKIC